MKILVCVKQVPDPDAVITADARVGLVQVAGDSYVMNRLDEYAMERALCLCEGLGSGSVEAITVGPDRAETAARRALAMGADHAIHIKIKENQSTAFETASLIGAVARDRGYDLIMAGVMSQDEMAGAVGPMVAAVLDMVWTTSVVSCEIFKGAVHAQKESEGGVLEELRLQLPALLTIQSGAGQPRYPNLTNMLRANKQPIEEIAAQYLAAVKPREKVISLLPPDQKGEGVFLEGSTQDKATELVRILRERALL